MHSVQNFGLVFEDHCILNCFDCVQGCVLPALSIFSFGLVTVLLCGCKTGHHALKCDLETLEGQMLHREDRRKQLLTNPVNSSKCAEWLDRVTTVKTQYSASKQLGRRPCVIFTSAGDHNNIHYWLKGHERRRWDLIIHYYGNGTQAKALQNVADVFVAGPGAKYSSLDDMYSANSSLLENYQIVGVIDDDAAGINVATLNFMCDVVAEQSLIVASPSIQGHHYLQENAQMKTSYIRRGAFFDMTYNFWNRQFLEDYLQVRDQRFTGSCEEIMIWNLFGFGNPHHNRCISHFFAVVDAVVFLNPALRADGVREAERDNSIYERRRVAQCIMQDLSDFGFRTRFATLPEESEEFSYKRS